MHPRFLSFFSKKFIARINPNATIEEGQNINLAIDPTKLHYFDPETGMAIT